MNHQRRRLALCGLAAALFAGSTTSALAQQYDPDLDIGKKFVQRTFPTDDLTALTPEKYRRAFPATFRGDNISFPGALFIATHTVEGVVGPEKVYYNDQVARWNSTGAVESSTRNAKDLAVLKGAGSTGLDLAAILYDNQLEVYGWDETIPGFSLLATLPSWSSVSKIWTCTNDQGVDELFGLNASTGWMYRVTYDAASASFVPGTNFRTPTTTLNVSGLEYSSANGGRELAVLGGNGFLYITSWSGHSIVDAHYSGPNGATTQKTCVVPGGPGEGDFVAWLHSNASLGEEIDIFNAQNASQTLVVNTAASNFILNSIHSGDWELDGDNDLVLSGVRDVVNNPVAECFVWRRQPDSPHSNGSLVFADGIGPAFGAQFIVGQDLAFTDAETAILSDYDQDGDVDFIGLSNNSGSMHVLENKTIDGLRPVVDSIEYWTWGSFDSQTGTGQIDTHLTIKLPWNWTTQAPSATHLRLQFFVDGDQQGYDLDAGPHTVLIPIPSGAGNSTVLPTQHIAIPTGVIDPFSFGYLTLSGLVKVTNGNVDHVYATEVTEYGYTAFFVDRAEVRQQLDRLGVAQSGGGGDGDETTSGERPDGGGTPPSGGG